MELKHVVMKEVAPDMYHIETTSKGLYLEILNLFNIKSEKLAKMLDEDDKTIRKITCLIDIAHDVKNVRVNLAAGLCKIYILAVLRQRIEDGLPRAEADLAYFIRSGTAEPMSLN